MATSDHERLFLLEVLVESVYISNSSLNLNQATKSNLRETCVMFQFLNYPPLVVCEEDFYKSSGSNDTQLNFKSGKSCIFSIQSSMMPSLPSTFDINVSVIRKVNDQPNNKIILGNTTICLGDSFSALMHSTVDAPDLPLQKIKTGIFDINDESNRRIGNISAFIRLSCFGQLIVTQFQVGANHDAFMFKGTEPKEIGGIPGDSSKSPKIERDPNYQVVKPAENPQYVEPDSSPRGFGDSPYGYDGYGMERGMVPYQPPPPQEPEGDYKEIVAEIRGHSLHIRVPKSQKKPKGPVCKKQLVEELEGPVCKFAPPLNLCDCDFPVPPEATPRCGGL